MQRRAAPPRAGARARCAMRSGTRTTAPLPSCWAWCCRRRCALSGLGPRASADRHCCQRGRPAAPAHRACDDCLAACASLCSNPKSGIASFKQMAVGRQAGGETPGKQHERLAAQQPQAIGSGRVATGTVSPCAAELQAEATRERAAARRKSAASAGKADRGGAAGDSRRPRARRSAIENTWWQTTRCRPRSSWRRRPPCWSAARARTSCTATPACCAVRPLRTAARLLALCRSCADTQVLVASAAFKRQCSGVYLYQPQRSSAVAGAW